MLHGFSLMRQAIDCHVQKTELIPKSVTVEPAAFLDGVIMMLCKFPRINNKNPSSLHASAKLLDDKFLHGIKLLSMTPPRTGKSEGAGTDSNRQVAR